MGDLPSKEEREKSEKKELHSFVKGLKEGPDLSVSKNIETFTGLSSSESLRQYYQKRRMKASDCAPGWIKNLVEKLGGLTSDPTLAGLGALAIAVFIDIVSFSPAEESTKEALRCVFAEEKVSEVWDLIDECLKRCVMYFNQRAELVSNIKHIEIQLSAALTKLKNSMVRDEHVSSHALKVWVNGAAFHIQMLIHLVRLGGIQTCDPVERLLSAYQRDLDTLFGKHREMIQSKCRMKLAALYQEELMPYLVDEDSNWHLMDPSIKNHYEKYFVAYYDHKYVRQNREIQQYFREVEENLQELVHQRGYFHFN